MPTNFWKSPDSIKQLNDLDHSGFALEFLRRNPEYRQDYRETRRRIERGAVDEATALSSIARRWGLQFRS
ncbi:transcriptional regulator domain-containing protein [Methylosinus sporium]|uniref:transcriptional regulator domain-containing protein n=1 Tax=Methylosinus sporium TaxID=428 RepID=UPI00383A39DE